MLFREIIAVYCENRMRGQNAEFLDTKDDGTYRYHYCLKSLIGPSQADSIHVFINIKLRSCLMAIKHSYGVPVTINRTA
jgi:hypothetical protein